MVGTEADNQLVPSGGFVKIGFEAIVVGPDKPAPVEQLKERFGRLADHHIEAFGGLRRP